MSDAPEKIWAAMEDNGDTYIKWGGKDPIDDDCPHLTEYTRTDTIPSAAYVATLERIAGYIAGTNTDHVRVALAGNPIVCDSIINDASAVLASRPASPDVRVVTVEQLERWMNLLQGSQRSMVSEIRSIIRGQP